MDLFRQDQVANRRLFFLARRKLASPSISSTILIFSLIESDLKCSNCSLIPLFQSGRCFRIERLCIARFFLNDLEMRDVVPVFVASGLLLHSDKCGNVHVSKPDALG